MIKLSFANKNILGNANQMYKIFMLSIFKCMSKKIVVELPQLPQLNLENTEFKSKQQENKNKYLFDMGFDNQYTPVFAIYGYMLAGNELKDVKSNLERLINEKSVQKQQKFQKRISLIYFSIAMEKKVIQYKTFKREVLQQLSNDCIKSIKEIYVLQEKSVSSALSFFHQFFGNDQKSELFRQLTRSFTNLEDIAKILGPLFKPELIIKQQVKNDNQEIHKPVEVKKLNQNKGMNQNEFKKNPLQKIKFNSEQNYLKLNILIEVLESHPQFCKSQGIFRRSSNWQNVKNLYQGLNTNHQKLLKQQISNKYDAYTIANCIKKFLAQLEIVGPELIVKIMERIENKQTQQNISGNKFLAGKHLQNGTVISCDQKMKQDQIKDDLLLFIGQSMGEVERKILHRLLIFFKKSILPNQNFNLMSPNNLSIVLNPCLFKFQSRDHEEFQKEIRKLLNLFLQMLKSPEKLYRPQILTVKY